MAVPELQSEALKWQRRINMMQGAGLNPAPIQELARTDLARLVRGGSPLPEDQITSMVYGAYTGQAQASQKPSESGADNSPFHWIGNAFSDIGTDVRSFGPGIAHEVADIFNPHKWSQVPADLGKVASDLPNVSKAAKDFGLTPIVGPLVPGTFALSAGWSGFTHHPLNFLLDVLPYADDISKVATIGAHVGEEDALHTAMSAFKAGHPFQGIARATGIEEKFTQMLMHSGGAAAEMSLMPVWRRYNMLARVYSNQLVKSALDELVSSGIIKKGMNLKERHELLKDAMTYNPRYERLAHQIDPARVSGDFTESFGLLPHDHDVKVWQIPDGSDAVYFSEDQARAAMDPAVRGEIQPVAGRAPISTLVPSESKWTAKNIIPASRNGKEIFYNAETKTVLDKIRKFTEQYRSTDKAKRAIEGTQPDSLLINGETYRRDSPPARAQEKQAAAAKKVDRAKQRHAAAQQAVEEAKTTLARYNQEHYRRFGESEAQASERGSSLPTLDKLGEAAQSFIAHGIAGDDRYRRLFYKLDDAFKSGRLKDVRTAVRNLVSGTTGDAAINDYAKYLTTKLRGVRHADTVSIAAAQRVARLSTVAHAAGEDLARTSGELEGATKELSDALFENPPSSANYLLEGNVRSHAAQRATRDYMDSVAAAKKNQGINLGTAIQELTAKYHAQLDAIEKAGSKEEMMSAIGGEDAAKSLAVIERDAVHDWAQMVQAGYHPIWTHKIDSTSAHNMTFGSIRPLTGGKYLSKAEVDQVLDYAPREMDIGLVLPATAFEYLRSESTKQFVDYLVNKSGYVKPEEELAAELAKRHKNWTPEQIKAEIDDNYADFHPSEYVDGVDKSVVYKMPKAAEEGFRRLARGTRVPFKKAHDPLMRVFKVSVLSGPRHMVHVLFGGLMMQGLRDPGAVLAELAHPLEAWKAVRSGTLPEDVARLTDANWFRENVLQGNYEETIDAMTQVRASKRLGEWLQESVNEGEFSLSDIPQKAEKVLQMLNNIENTATDMYRTATFLHDVRNNASIEAAMQKVHKIFIDVDNLTPFEQLTIRNVYPFWTFTKHIMRYVLTMPADHPIRAAILARLSGMVEQQGKGWTDPLRLQKLFFLGEPDAKGSVKTLDMSNLNPFRSMASIFSMSGFVSGLTPELQTALKMFGINPLSGVPSLHQNFAYDAYVGSRVATRPHLNPFDYVSSFVPEAEIADHFLLFTDTMRQLKKSNPEAYARSFWQEINFPFALAPINIYDVRAKAAQGQFLDAQQSVADAMRTGEVGPVRTFDSVPFQGQLYDANSVANYIEHFDKLFPGLAPRATYTKPRQIRRRALLR